MIYFLKNYKIIIISLHHIIFNVTLMNETLSYNNISCKQTNKIKDTSNSFQLRTEIYLKKK